LAEINPLKGRMNVLASVRASMGSTFNDKFVKLQGDVRFFSIECILSSYLILAQGMIADKFLVGSINNLSNKWTFSKTT
jgi:hypothetical protein